MARALTIYLKRDDVPARKALQGALDPLGFKIVLDEAYAPFATKGYVPCALDGEDAGFNLRFAEVETEARSEFALGDDAVAIVIRWGGDPREELAAVAVAAAFIEGFDATVASPETGTKLSAEELRAKARQLANSL
jgi:hypothetical protein